MVHHAGGLDSPPHPVFGKSTSSTAIKLDLATLSTKFAVQGQRLLPKATRGSCAPDLD